MKIPTAEEFFKSKDLESIPGYEVMIKFAKLHVEAALKAASERAECSDDINGDSGEGSFWVNKQSILDAYPLTNIK